MGRTESMLKSAMEAQYGNGKAFSEALEMPYSTIRSILERGIVNAKLDNIITICQKLGITTEELINIEKGIMTLDKDRTYIDNTLDIMQELAVENKKLVFEYAVKIRDRQESGEHNNILRFPVTIINKASAGTGYMYGENGDEVVYCNRNIKPYDFAVSAKGNSMEPLISNGDAILCRKDFDFENGHLYVVDYDGESYIKKVYDIGHQLRLVSENKEYQDILLDNNDFLKIVGSVVDWFTPYAR